MKKSMKVIALALVGAMAFSLNVNAAEMGEYQQPVPVEGQMTELPSSELQETEGTQEEELKEEVTKEESTDVPCMEEECKKAKDQEGMMSEEEDSAIQISKSSENMYIKYGETVYIDCLIDTNGNANQRVYVAIADADGDLRAYASHSCGETGIYNWTLHFDTVSYEIPSGDYTVSVYVENWNGSGWTTVESSKTSTVLHITDVDIPLNSMVITQGKDTDLTIHFNPENTTISTSIEWTSSNDNICEIMELDNNHNVFPWPNAVGDVTITASLKNGKGSTSVPIHVDENGDARIVTPVTNFVNRLYNKCLGRQSEAEGLSDWATKLALGQASGADVASGFVFSDEYKNKNTSNEDFVEMMYVVFMDRASDAAGKNDWVDKLNNGMSREYVCSGFINSTEFAGICSNYGINTGSFGSSQFRDRNYGLTSFMARCYTKALGRSYDADGLEYWCKEISEGRYTIDGAATTGFFNSQEFANKNTTNDEYVTILYHTFFDREPDKAGYDDWMNQLKTGKNDRNGVMSGFANSQEFANLKARYGL